MYDEQSINKQIKSSDAYFMSSCVIDLTVPSNEDIFGFPAGFRDVICELLNCVAVF